MRLAIITDTGEIEDVSDPDDDIRDYDLSKPFAVAAIIDDIKRALIILAEHSKE